MKAEDRQRRTVEVWLAMIRHPAAWAMVLLAAGLLAAPLPFASVVPAAATSLRVTAFAALGLAAFVYGRERRRTPPGLLAGALALAAVAALGWLQAVPWPRAVAGAVSPAHVRAWERARQVVEPQVPELLPGEPGSAAGPSAGSLAAATSAETVPLSLAPAVTLDTAWGWAAMAAAFLAAGLAGGRRHRRRWLAGALAAGGLFQVLYGARRWVEHLPTIWGVEVPGGGGRLRGTFINPNHLAAYLEVVLAVLVAWAWWAWRRALREPSMERRVLLAAPPVLLLLPVLGGLALTGSRGGTAGVAVALPLMISLILGRWSLRSGRSRKGAAGASSGAWRWLRVPLAVTLAGAVLAGVAWLGFGRAFGRLATTSAYEVGWGERARVYRGTWELWRDFPWTGSGLGSFREAFPRFQDPEVPGTWIHAHSDPLELLATGGVVALLALLVGLVAVVRRLVRVWNRGRSSEDRAAALAAFGALAALGVHEAVGFGLTMPANAFTVAVVVGAAAGARLRRSSPGPVPPEARPRRSPRSRARASLRPGSPSPADGDPAGSPPAAPGEPREWR